MNEYFVEGLQSAAADIRHVSGQENVIKWNPYTVDSHKSHTTSGERLLPKQRNILGDSKSAYSGQGLKNTGAAARFGETQLDRNSDQHLGLKLIDPIILNANALIPDDDPLQDSQNPPVNQCRLQEVSRINYSPEKAVQARPLENAAKKFPPEEEGRREASVSTLRHDLELLNAVIEPVETDFAAGQLPEIVMRMKTLQPATVAKLEKIVEALSAAESRFLKNSSVADPKARDFYSKKTVMMTCDICKNFTGRGGDLRSVVACTQRNVTDS